MSNADIIRHLERRRDVMKQYIELRLEMEDWHGVRDAAADLETLESQLTLLREIERPPTPEVSEARANDSANESILRSVNEAINRAGIYCAITFVEAIDQIAKERDEARAEVERLKNEPRTTNVTNIVEKDRAHP